MGHDFSSELEAVIAAEPDAIWDAIATTHGIDSWSVGHNAVEPPGPDGEGGVVRIVMGDFTPVADITTWEPPHRLAYAMRPGPDGRYLGYEYLVEGRDRSSSVVRLVVDGFLPQDDWEDEYEAMTLGGALFFATLGEYAARFPGRAGTPVVAFGPPVTDWEGTWQGLYAWLGLGGTPAPGDTATIAGPGPTTETGEVYHVNPHTLGIRTPTTLYRFLRAFGGPLMTSHVVFDAAGPDQVEGWARCLTGIVPQVAAPDPRGRRPVPPVLT